MFSFLLKKPLLTHPGTMAQVTSIDFNNISLGNISFRGLDINLQGLANQLQGYVTQGSKRYQLSANNINVNRNHSAPQPTPVTLEWLLNQGNALFDSLIALAIPAQVTIGVRPPGQDVQPNTPDSVAKAVFFQYFLILTRGSMSDIPTTRVGQDVPNFLSNILGCNASPLIYARLVCSFGVNLIDPGWVKYITVTNLGVEARNRLGLGLAGYRTLGPFKLLTPNTPIPPALQRPYEVAQSMARANPNWDFHSATRDPNLLNTYGPINANLSNLALELFDHNDLQGLVDNRSLFAIPVRDNRVVNYRTWNVDYHPDPTNDIF